MALRRAHTLLPVDSGCRSVCVCFGDVVHEQRDSDVCEWNRTAGDEMLIFPGFDLGSERWTASVLSRQR